MIPSSTPDLTWVHEPPAAFPAAKRSSWCVDSVPFAEWSNSARGKAYVFGGWNEINCWEGGRWFEVRIPQSPSSFWHVRDKRSLQRRPESECSVVLHVVVSMLQPWRQRSKSNTSAAYQSLPKDWLPEDFLFLFKTETGIGNLCLCSWKELKSAQFAGKVHFRFLEISGHPKRETEDLFAG